MAYKLAVSYPEAQVGTLVYDYKDFDFGHAFSKHRLSGRNTKSVTTNPEGTGEFFVVFTDDLEEAGE